MSLTSTPTKSRRRTALISAALSLLVVASVTVIAAPADAATVCNNVTRRFEVRQSGAGIGDLRFVTSICTSGSTMTSSSGKVTWSASPLGLFTGWTYQNFGTPRSFTGSNYAGWTNTGVFKLCVPTQISPLCAYGQTYKASFNGYSKSFIGPIPLPSVACTNSYCRNGMTFVYTGTE